MTAQDNDELWMRRAMVLAARAGEEGEIPVGAVLVKDDKVIGEGWNRSIQLNDPSAHAEMQAIRQAGVALENYRMLGTTLYVTLEPCPMCAGLMVHSRIRRLVFGAADPKTGAAGTVMDLVRDERLNHQIDVVSGVLAEECSEQLSAFFRRRRAEKKALRQQQKQEGGA